MVETSALESPFTDNEELEAAKEWYEAEAASVRGDGAVTKTTMVILTEHQYKERHRDHLWKAENEGWREPRSLYRVAVEELRFYFILLTMSRESHTPLFAPLSPLLASLQFPHISQQFPHTSFTSSPVRSFVSNDPSSTPEDLARRIQNQGALHSSCTSLSRSNGPP